MEKPAQWELDVMKWGEEKGLITPGAHTPDEPITMATLMAVLKNSGVIK